MIVLSAVDSNGSLGTRIESEVFSLHVSEFVMFDVVNNPVVVGLLHFIENIVIEERLVSVCQLK